MSATVLRQFPLWPDGDVWIVLGEGDPSSDGGLTPTYGIGSEFRDTATGDAWRRVGTGPTDWTLSTVGGGGTSLPAPDEGDLLIGMGGSWVQLARPVDHATEEYGLGFVGGLPAWRHFTAPPPVFTGLFPALDLYPDTTLYPEAP